LAGCFEHYPQLKLVDDGWSRFEKMHDWIYWFESINKRSWEIGAQTEMWSYLPWSFVGWKTLFANTRNDLPEYPRVDYQNHLARQAFDEVTAELTNCLSATTRSQFNALSIVTELGPSLVNLMNPEIKLINSQLVRPEEKITLSSMVEIMQHCNLNFVVDKNDQGQSFYRLEPPLEVFVQFEGTTRNQFAGPAKFQLRQLITSELNSARLKARRMQMGKDANDSGNGRAHDAQGYKDAYAKSLAGGSARSTTTVDGSVPATRIPVDFFGRPILAKSTKQSIPAALLPTLPDPILGRRKEKENEADDQMHQIAAIKKAKLKVFYNYHEGYSNAVRKPVKMSSLLL
jgi:chromosome transmission fidelity protein 18